MKRAQVFNSALLFFVVSASATAYAQGGGEKKDTPPEHGKAAQSDKHAQAPTPDHGKKTDKPAPAQQRQQAKVSAPDRGRSQAKPAPVQVAQRRQPVQASAPARGRSQARPAPVQTVQQRQAVQTSRRPAPPLAVPAVEQRQRAQAEQQRAAQYRQRLDQQVRLGQQQAALAQQQRRAAQYRAEQQYLAQLRAQQLRLQTARNYSNDPYIRTAPSYRYAYSGVNRETNQYGADVLRQAVNYGYQEGVRFGQADRQDGLTPNFQNSYAYRDANYGYAGNYVDQSDYNYYFRQGFQRGYTDGYNSRSQYGTTLANGNSSILAGLLTTILGLTSLR
jgi:hypothetical protein